MIHVVSNPRKALLTVVVARVRVYSQQHWKSMKCTCEHGLRPVFFLFILTGLFYERKMVKSYQIEMRAN